MERKRSWLTNEDRAHQRKWEPPGDSSSSSRRPRRANWPATWAPATSSNPRGATSATCPGPPPTCRPSSSPSRGPGSGVNVDADFEPLYIISPEKKSTVTELKGLLKDVDELYLATDGDREGEAIAWHLLETLKPRIPVKRMVFHEITEPAILEAAQNPRDLDIDLVDAQETRRILDRLYGYEVSPVLWKKVAPKLSAGRVQSVATRIIVQRERDRMAFRSASYWDILAKLDASVSDPQAQPPTFTARLTNVDGLRVATGRDFDSLGMLRKADEVVVLDEARATELAAGLQRRAAHRGVGGGEALHPASLPAVHDVDAAAGGRPQVAVLLGAHDEHRPAALRERLHHLYAYRLDDAVGVGDQRRAHPGPAALRRRSTSPRRRVSTPAR